jgi:hypothetical protein
MARLFALVCAVALGLTVVAQAQTNVAGAWELSINGPEGVLSATADLKQDGDKLTGTITAPQGSANMTGNVKGKAVFLTFSMDTPQGPIEIKINGEVEGDSVKGVLDFGMGQADFTGKKK